MKFQKEDFLKHIKEIKKAIKNYTDEELFEEELQDTKKIILNSLTDGKENYNLILFSYDCWKLSSYGGGFLYDSYGNTIKNNQTLKFIMESKKDKPKFVIPVDVHY